jgi:hypothetical protein
VFQLSAISDVDEDYEDEPEEAQGQVPLSPSAHQQQKKASRPAETRCAYMSENVLTFFSTTRNKRNCLFCL